MFDDIIWFASRNYGNPLFVEAEETTFFIPSTCLHLSDIYYYNLITVIINANNNNINNYCYCCCCCYG